jgi:MoCo/4Fe-4S cofactor protein with predicted Tat translocation signal
MPSLEDRQGGYWRSLQEYAATPEFRALCAEEFPRGADAPPDTWSRRGFLKIMGASVALAGLAGCRWPRETIVPRAYQPAGQTPGQTRSFATAFELAGSASGLLVTSFEGRPIKVEGNPEDPVGRGAADALAQAAILELYDPDRSRGPIRRDGGGELRQEWPDFAAAAAGLFAPLRAGGGRGLAVLAEGSNSPALAAQRERFLAAYPAARWHVWEPLNQDHGYAGTALAFGRPLRPVPDLAAAEVILALDADLLADHPAALALARGYAAGRNPDARMNRLYAVESRFSITGSMADHRLPLRASRIEAFALALAAALTHRLETELPAELRALSHGIAAPMGAEFDAAFLAALVDDLLAARAGALIVAGPGQPPRVHALVALLNQLLGGVGRTLRYVAPPAGEETDQLASLGALARRMATGEVEALVILGGNPVYDAPADLDFAGGLARVGTSVHLSLYDNETSRRCRWHLPRAHWLECWGDALAWDGTYYSVQPLIEPLYGGKSPIELLDLLAEGAGAASGHDRLRESQAARLGADDESAWRRLLHDGVLADSAFPAQSVALATAPLAAALAAPPTAPADTAALELVLHRDHCLFDGRFANNGWLQELPDPLSRITWDNAAAIGPATAAALDLVHGDRVRLSAAGRSLECAVAVLPGLAPGTVAIALGYGRSAAGAVGNGVGFDAYRLRASDALHTVPALGVTKLGGSYLLAGTQDHYLIDPIGFAGREARVGELVRSADLATYRDEPDFARHAGHHPPLVSLWQEHAYEGHRWGMAIDLNTCIGCGSCAVACQAENNIPVVGKEQVARGREMSWIRLDRYFEGEPENPASVVQPVACMQCELAPCEQVCPFQATVHSSEGLNDMVYNRCVGTRYCANNCPYKVRRFNFFNFNKDVPEVTRLAFNPEVTVRSRGVMEKCTYCVQRIQNVKIQAKNEGRPLADGDIKPACQQTCPTQAIRFGDLNDPASAVGRLHGDHRAYSMLGELNTKPRTAYLARVTNPNPNLASPQHEQRSHS